MMLVLLSISFPRIHTVSAMFAEICKLWTIKPCKFFTYFGKPGRTYSLFFSTEVFFFNFPKNSPLQAKSIILDLNFPPMACHYMSEILPIRRKRFPINQSINQLINEVTLTIELREFTDVPHPLWHRTSVHVDFCDTHIWCAGLVVDLSLVV